MEKKNTEEISVLNLKLDMEVKQKETLELTMQMLSNYLEEELPLKLQKYAKSIELDSLKNELILYLKDEVNQIKDQNKDIETQKKDKVTKTLAEAFGVNIYNLKPAGKI